MPKYEYACRSCGEHLEVVQAFTDDALTECPACGGSLRKVFGNIGVVLKGSGFYKTDNRTSADRRRSSSESGDGARTDKGDKGDKPESKGESRGSDSKGSDSKGSDSKGSDSSSAAKPADTKSADSKTSSAPKVDTAAKSA